MRRFRLLTGQKAPTEEGRPRRPLVCIPMSWSATSDEVRSSNLWADLAGIEATGQDYSLLSVSEAVAAARMAAGDLIESGALGEDKVFRVTLAGHANDGHNPDPPWTNDTISVTVSQIRDE